MYFHCFTVEKLKMEKYSILWLQRKSRDYGHRKWIKGFLLYDKEKRTKVLFTGNTISEFGTANKTLSCWENILLYIWKLFLDAFFFLLGGGQRGYTSLHLKRDSH